MIKSRSNICVVCLCLVQYYRNLRYIFTEYRVFFFHPRTQRGNDNLNGGDDDDWLIGDYARHAVGYDQDLPVVIDFYRVWRISSTAGLTAPGPFGSLMVTPFRLVPNDLDELNPLQRSFFETAAAVAIQQMVTAMENGFAPVCRKLSLTLYLGSVSTQNSIKWPNFARILKYSRRF
jgi:hypothetical protein